jgi:hypothetical protein
MSTIIASSSTGNASSKSPPKVALYAGVATVEEEELADELEEEELADELEEDLELPPVSTDA